VLKRRGIRRAARRGGRREEGKWREGPGAAGAWGRRESERGRGRGSAADPREEGRKKKEKKRRERGNRVVH
jgi:hypothetical protein